MERVLGPTAKTYLSTKTTTVKVDSDPEGADVDFGSKSGGVDGMASYVPPLAPSLKVDKVEKKTGSMTDNVEQHKTARDETRIDGESSLALISSFQVGEEDEAEGVKSGWMLKGCRFGGGLRQCAEENGSG